jgi:hypothetical protein
MLQLRQIVKALGDQIEDIKDLYAQIMLVQVFIP